MLLEAGDSQWWPPLKGTSKRKRRLLHVVIWCSYQISSEVHWNFTGVWHPTGLVQLNKVRLGLAIKLTGFTSSNAVSVVLRCCYTNPCVASLGTRRYFVHLDGTWRAATEPGPDEVSSRTAWREGWFLSGVLHSCPHKIFIKSNFFFNLD